MSENLTLWFITTYPWLFAAICALPLTSGLNGLIRMIENKKAGL